MNYLQCKQVNTCNNYVQNSCKAIIERDHYILFIKRFDRINNLVYYTLPGGKQKLNEDLLATLKREVKEETNIKVDKAELIYIREYISNRHKSIPNIREQHLIEFIFRCDALSLEDIKTIKADYNQVGLEWIRQDHLIYKNIYPKFLKEIDLHINNIHYNGECN